MLHLWTGISWSSNAWILLEKVCCCIFDSLKSASTGLSKRDKVHQRVISVMTDRPLVSPFGSLYIREWPSHSELTVPRWECPEIPLIPVIPSTVMSGHVFSLNRERDGVGEKVGMWQGGVFMVDFNASVSQLPFKSGWKWLYLVIPCCILPDHNSDTARDCNIYTKHKGRGEIEQLR